ncbi:efflux transporter outer membrane subunit [Klebsiella sp. RHBSTW-00484]|uniref:efflux transporter outer membrane subunit n=1 Tax=unclassified Klebsiella TaxID=2608929 RepID=UPI0015E49CC3|nr:MULTISPECIES: efflux transporter outer membrane subunit [unclassified Klebsiella]MBA7844422.1 efflux transporter outer membrane subunit [Klebsiella sp. RHBSTW-00465]QLO34355.1 efflux transporter outer membrane subunit [Klebsiella sp. RHBSTW-00484]QLT73869.1 efflux transporter outer membrane subunit [Klebsiella sp. RHBSTW-00464]
MFRFTLVFVALLTAGCVSLDPNYERPAAPIPTTLPGSHGEATAVVSDWQQVVNDARLKKVVSIALTSNRDVQKALADIEAARAQLGETRAALFPTLDAELSHTRSKTVASGLTSSSEADGAVSSFELDLFGKNQSLTRAARETWLASEFTAQNTRLTMIADLTIAWVTLAADNSNLALAQDTMASAENSRKIVNRQMEVGTASASDLSDAESVYQQARASVASYRTLVAQDKNALNLLAGETVPDSLLPGTLESLGDRSITLIPAGVSSSVLLRRPDIQEAEHNLKSANADIGAARANFFPSISLTASAGVGSDSLSSLFSHGMQVWSFAPSISLPLFTGGSNLAQLRYAEAEKKGLIATYEKTIQSAFKDVADALARRETLSEQLDAQNKYVAAEQKSLDIAMKSYQAGVGDYLSVLTAQRTLWSAQATLISLQQTDLENRITLWQSLGGGAS